MYFYQGSTIRTWMKAFTGGGVNISDGQFGSFRDVDNGWGSLVLGDRLWVANEAAAGSSNVFLGPLNIGGFLAVTNWAYIATNVAPFAYSNAWLTATNSRKTNIARRGTWEMDAGLVDVVGGVPLLEITVEDAAMALTNVWACQVPGGLASTITNHYSFRIGPGVIVSCTNKSSGTGGDAYIARSRMTWE